MIQLCQQRQAGLNLSPDQRGGIQQITWLQVNRSGSVRSFAARVISQIYSPERAKRAENVFRRDLITLKIPRKAYPRESRGWSCRCRSSSRSRGEGCTRQSSVPQRAQRDAPSQLVQGESPSNETGKDLFECECIIHIPDCIIHIPDSRPPRHGHQQAQVNYTVHLSSYGELNEELLFSFQFFSFHVHF